MFLNGCRFGLAVAVFLSGALVLTVPRGIGYAVLPLLLISLVMLGSGFRKPSQKLSDNEWLFIIAMVAYPLATALAMIVQGDWVWSHFDKPSRFLLAVPVFLAIRKYGSCQRALYWGFVIGAIGAGALGYTQKYLWGWTYASGYTHKIPFGDISLMLGALAVTYLIKSSGDRGSRLLQIAAVAALVFGMVGSIASATRGGWVAIPFMGWLILSAMVDNRKLRYGVFSLLIGCLLAIYWGNDLVHSKVNSAITTAHNYFSTGEVAGSAGSRFEMWRGAWLQFKGNPIVGGGKNSYGPQLTQQINEGLVNPGRVYTHAHNDFLNVLAEYGLLGGTSLVVFYALTILFFIRLRSVDLRMATAGLVLCFGYVDFSVTQAMLEHNISTAFLSFMLAIIAGLLSHRALVAERRQVSLH